MRALNKSWIGLALVILFGASLFFFRGSSRYSNLFNSDNFVANVSGTQISTTQFLRALELNIGQFAQMIGEDLSGDQIRAFQIHQLVLQNLISDAIFENEFDNLNFILDETIIAENTKRRFPNLYINNKINDDVLNSFLRQQRLKIDDLVNIIDFETREDVFENLIFEKNYPNLMASKINRTNAQIRNINLIKLNYEEIKSLDEEGKLTKDNIELNDYFNQNSMNYMTQEKRDIEYLFIDKELYKKDFIPNENEISNYYNDNKKIFSIPEKRSFNQFNFKSKEEAENFKSSISDLLFEDILLYASNNKIKYNEFEDITSDQTLEELSNVIFQLNKGDISDVIKTALSYHVVILSKISLERTQSLNEVYENIKNTLTNVKLDNFFNDLKSSINQQILNGSTISEIANKNNLQIMRLNNVVEDQEDNEFISSVINTAFSQNKDFISDLFDFNNNKSFILNVSEIYPSKVENIEIIFNKVKADFIRSNKQKFASDTFENYKLDKDLKNIKSVFNTEIETLETNIESDNIPKSFIKSIFDSELNSLVFSSDKDHVYFAVVNDIKIPEEITINQEINLISELKNAFGSEIIKTKKISINDELINGLLSQYK
tara:strand:+ start:37 stop:1854 length:1818 start_codon:yes stop_codon:yes gene_type:complete